MDDYDNGLEHKLVRVDIVNSSNAQLWLVRVHSNGRIYWINPAHVQFSNRRIYAWQHKFLSNEEE